MFRFAARRNAIVVTAVDILLHAVAFDANVGNWQQRYMHLVDQEIVASKDGTCKLRPVM